MAKRSRPLHQYSADLVWAAAWAAYRINGGYHKNPMIEDGKIIKPTNRELVQMYLTDDSDQPITKKDTEQGQNCRRVLANSVTMSMLKNELTEWGELTARMTSLETVTTDYEISVITAMPKSYYQVILRENTDSRLAHCDGPLVGRINDRVDLEGEIVRCSYSNRFNTFYITVITKANQQVFFAYREQLNTGRNIRFCGRVKRHADRATQLSRVKLVEQEAV
jgi:flagella basal body P-ring formation protein FlgA